MDPSNFDDFIKSNTRDELPVPTELSWENMDFNLPKAKRKRRILPWLLFLLIGTTGMGGGLWYVYQQNDTQTQSLAKINTSGLKNQNNINSLKKEADIIDMALTQDAEENKSTRENVPNQKTSGTEPPSTIEMEGGKGISRNQATQLNNLESAKAENINQPETSLIANTEITSQTLRERLVSLTWLNVLSLEPIRSTSTENHLTVTSHPIADPQTKQLTKPLALLVSFGVNRVQMNHSNSRMNDTETPAWGNSYQILLEQEMKANWLISIGLGYQRLHTTFTFDKDLGTYVDLSQFQVIKETRHVFHNNYVDVVSLNLGGGKQFIFSPRWKGQLLMYLSPAHRLSYTGRSIDDTENIINLDINTTAQKKWLLNADAALRFSYSLKNTDLLFGVNLSQSLTKTDLLSGSNNTTTVQPRVLGLNLGIKRSFGMRR